MAMLVFELRLLLPGSLSLVTVLVWTGADRLSARDLANMLEWRQSSCELIASGALLPSSFPVSVSWPLISFQ